MVVKELFETKIVVYNTSLLYRRIRLSVNKAGIFRFSFTVISQM